MLQAVTSVQKVIEDWTGAPIKGCPWRVFFDPYVQRVLKAFPYFDASQLQLVAPTPSYRLVEGLGVYSQARNRIEAEQIRADRKKEAQR